MAEVRFVSYNPPNFGWLRIQCHLMEQPHLLQRHALHNTPCVGQPWTVVHSANHQCFTALSSSSWGMLGLYSSWKSLSDSDLTSIDQQFLSNRPT